MATDPTAHDDRPGIDVAGDTDPADIRHVGQPAPAEDEREQALQELVDQAQELGLYEATAEPVTSDQPAPVGDGGGTIDPESNVAAQPAPAGDDELREAVDRAIAEWLRTGFALARASWAKDDAGAMDHLQYLHLGDHEVQLTPRILGVFAERDRELALLLADQPAPAGDDELHEDIVRERATANDKIGHALRDFVAQYDERGRELKLTRDTLALRNRQLHERKVELDRLRGEVKKLAFTRIAMTAWRDEAEVDREAADDLARQLDERGRELERMRARDEKAAAVVQGVDGAHAEH